MRISRYKIFAYPLAPSRVNEFGEFDEFVDTGLASSTEVWYHISDDGNPLRAELRQKGVMSFDYASATLREKIV